MISRQTVEEIVRAYLDGTDVELVDLQADSSGRIVVEVDSYKGVDVDFCAALNRHLREQLGAEADDCELEVGTVSLTDPFKTKMQYEKNIGHDVEVLACDGKKYKGVLVSVNDTDFAVDVEVMVAVEGKKRKQKQVQTLVFAYDTVKYARYDLKI